MRYLPEIEAMHPFASRGGPSTAALPKAGLEKSLVMESPWGYKKRWNFVLEEVAREYPDRPPSSIRVLDVGCGNGSLLAIPLAQEGLDVTGVDLHGSSIAHAQRLASGLPNAHFVTGAVGDLADPAFDVVILSEVLEHVHDPETLLLASLTRLKPNGIAVITVPNGYGEFEIDSWVFRTFRLNKVLALVKHVLGRRPALAAQGQIADQSATDNEDCPHVQFFTMKRLRRMFRQCSLGLVRVSPGAFACGPMVCSILGRSQRFIEWNARVSDRLPLLLASSWYFVLRRPQATSY